MKEVLEHIIKNLVLKKENVIITEDINDRLVKYQISVDKDDFGRIIGHEGKIAKSIRLIMSAIATIKNVKVVVDIR